MSVLSSGEYYGRLTSRREASGGAVSYLEHRHGRRLPMHVHCQAYFSMILSGGYREESGRRSIEYETLTIVYHPPGTSHLDEIAPGGARFLMIEVNERLVEEAPAGIRQGRAIELDRAASWLALRTLFADAETIEVSILELLGRCADDPRSGRGAPCWLAHVLDQVRDEFRSPPTTAALAERAGVHPVHLARMVRRQTGQTLADVVRHRRVEQAARLLAGPATLVEISEECGFADQPHFNRVFRRETGLTPGQMRAAMRG